MDTKLFIKHLAKQQKLLVESDVSKTVVNFKNGVECVVIGDSDDFTDFTHKNIKSGLKKGAKFKASSTKDVLTTLKCDAHEVQPDQLKKIKSGTSTKLYVFVDPFHAQENGQRVVQIFVDKSKAENAYEESINYGAAPHMGGPSYEPY